MTKEHEDAYGHYSLTLEWDPHDRIYVVSVPEFPGCRTHGATYEEAVAQIQEVIAGWVDILRADGDPIPSPRTYARRPWVGAATGGDDARHGVTTAAPVRIVIAGDDEDDARAYQEEDLREVLAAVHATGGGRS